MNGTRVRIRRALIVAMASGGLLIAGVSPAGAGGSFSWEGQSWTEIGGTAALNGSDAILTRSADGEVGLRLDLPTEVNDAGTPWAEFSYVDDGTSMQGFDLFVNPDVSTARLSGGSLFDCDGLGFSRHSVPAVEEVDFGTGPKCGPDLLGTDRTPGAHTIYVGQRDDGTIDWQFDGVWQTPSTFLKDASPTPQAPFAFEDVYLRWRSAATSGTATFTGFDFGGDHVAPSEATPDAAIRTGVSNSEFKQFGFTSAVATGQQTAKDTAPPKVSKTFRFRADNIGDFAGAFTVTGEGASNGFRVKYYDQDDNNITGAVLAGTYEVDVDAGAQSPVLKVRVKPSGQTALSAKARPTITFESEDGEVDVVRAVLKRV
jgi:hypothetical protein